MELINRIQHAWSAFNDRGTSPVDHGRSSGNPAFKTVNMYDSASFVSSIYNRIAVDSSMVKLRHVKVDATTEDMVVQVSSLNDCFNIEANIDQTGIQFMHDLVYSMFDEGVVAVVPVKTTISPHITESYKIESLRVGKIIEWFPKHVRVRLYNEDTGQNEDILIAKSVAAIVENPLYAVINGENSVLKRLVSKITQLDAEDTAINSGRLDLVVHVPYGIKTNLQKAMAKERIEAIEQQLTLGKHGITFMDQTEKLTQLNRPINSQLVETIDKLTKQFYNQLGLTESIFNGTASEEELRFYYSRTIDPILEAIVAEFTRKFLTKTARTQGHEIQYYRDMFKFVTIEMISGLIDTVRRNSVLSTNEVRKILRIRPSNDPRADELFNPNIADKNQNTLPSPEQPAKTGSLTSPDDQPK